MDKQLIDIDDGENRAVRMFLLMYGGNASANIGAMRNHLRLSGFDGFWPDWAEFREGHLTTGGAQDWLRYLFNAETQSAAEIGRQMGKD